MMIIKGIERLLNYSQKKNEYNRNTMSDFHVRITARPVYTKIVANTCLPGVLFKWYMQTRDIYTQNAQEKKGIQIYGNANITGKI